MLILTNTAIRRISANGLCLVKLAVLEHVSLTLSCCCSFVYVPRHPHKAQATASTLRHITSSSTAVWPQANRKASYVKRARLPSRMVIACSLAPVDTWFFQAPCPWWTALAGSASSPNYPSRADTASSSWKSSWMMTRRSSYHTCEPGFSAFQHTQCYSLPRHAVNPSRCHHKARIVSIASPPPSHTLTCQHASFLLLFALVSHLYRAVNGNFAGTKYTILFGRVMDL